MVMHPTRILLLCMGMICLATTAGVAQLETDTGVTLLEGPKEGRVRGLALSPVSGTVVGTIGRLYPNVLDIVRSVDGGRTWSVRQRVVPPYGGETYVDLDVDPSGHFWILSDAGSVLRSTDDGMSWGTVRQAVIPSSSCTSIEATGTWVFLECTSIYRGDAEGKMWSRLDNDGYIIPLGSTGDTLVRWYNHAYYYPSFDAGNTFDTVQADTLIRWDVPFFGIGRDLYGQSDRYPIDGEWFPMKLWRSTDVGKTWTLEVDRPYGLPLAWGAAGESSLYGYRNDSIFIYSNGTLEALPIPPVSPLASLPVMNVAPVEVDNGIILPSDRGLFRYDRQRGVWEQVVGFNASRSEIPIEGNDRWVLSGRLLYRMRIDGGGGEAFSPPERFHDDFHAASLPGGDVASLGRHTLYIYRQESGTWTEARGLIEGIERKGEVRSLWTRDELMMASYAETQYTPAAVYIVSSTDRGRTWRAPADRLSRIPASYWIGPPPLSSSTDAFRLRRQIGDSTSTLYLSSSIDAGVTWNPIDSIELPEDFFATGTDQFEGDLISRPAVRGLDHVTMQVSDDRWITVSDQGIDTVHFHDEHQRIYGLTRHEGRYVGLVDSLSFLMPVHPQENRMTLIPRLRLVWREIGSPQWHYWEPAEVAGERIVRTVTTLPEQTFFVDGNRLHAVSHQNETWRVDSIPTGETLYTLTVNDGYGSGRHAAGERVDIWGRDPKEAEAFAGWRAVGDGTTEGTVERPREWHTTITMPAGDLEVTATFEDIPDFIRTARELPGYPSDSLDIMIRDFSGEPKGIILILQNGAWRAGRFFDEPDGLLFARDAAARGYVVALLASRESSAGDSDGNGSIAWDTSAAGGEDRRRCDVAIRVLKDLMIETAEIPFYVVASDAVYYPNDAGIMATRLATDYRLPAIAFLSASSRSDYFREMWSPSIFITGRDLPLPVNRESGPYSLYLVARLRGIGAEYHASIPLRLYPERFARIAGITPEMSASIHQELLTLVPYFLYDRNGDYLLSRQLYDNYANNPNSLLRMLASLSQEQKEQVWVQLAAIAAQGGIITDFNEVVLDFFDRHRLPAMPLGAEDETDDPVELDLSSTGIRGLEYRSAVWEE